MILSDFAERTNYPMARDEVGDLISGHGGSYRPGGAGAIDPFGKIAITAERSLRNLHQSLPYSQLKGGPPQQHSQGLSRRLWLEHTLDQRAGQVGVFAECCCGPALLQPPKGVIFLGLAVNETERADSAARAGE